MFHTKSDMSDPLVISTWHEMLIKFTSYAAAVSTADTLPCLNQTQVWLRERKVIPIKYGGPSGDDTFHTDVSRGDGNISPLKQGTWWESRGKWKHATNCCERQFLAVLICALTHFSSYFSQHLLIMPSLMCSAACLICYAVQHTASSRQKQKHPFAIPPHVHRDSNWPKMNAFSKSNGGGWVGKVKYPLQSHVQ